MDSTYVEESTKIASPHAWIWLLEITSAEYPNNPLLLTSDNDLVTWNERGPYVPMPFTVDDLHISTSGKFPEYRLQIEDVNLTGTLRDDIQSTGGLVGGTVRFLIVHSDHLGEATPAIDEYADILSCEITAQAVIFTIGIPNLLSRRFPRDRYVPGYCRHRFGGALCQYEQPPYSQYYAGNTTFSVPVVPNPTHPPANLITIGGSGNIVTAIFSHAKPTGKVADGRLALAKDTGFTISGSDSNDGFFLADRWYHVYPNRIYVYSEDEGGQVFKAEVSTGVTITLGYSACDHTLEACKFRDNTQNYGGSPGIVGGIYG